MGRNKGKKESKTKKMAGWRKKVETAEKIAKKKKEKEK